jgi:DNA-binding beta-propeller fold protein YncE
MAVANSGGGPHGAHGAGNVPGYVLKLDAVDGRQVGRVIVDPNPGDNVLSPDGRTLYVTHYDLIAWRMGAQKSDLRLGDSKVAIVDTESMTVTKKVPLCPAAHGVRTSKDGARLYATCGPDEIAVADLANPDLAVKRHSLPGTTPGAACARCPYGLDEAPDGTVWVFSLGAGVGELGGGTIDVFDPTRAPGPGFEPGRSVRLCGSAVFGAFAPNPQGGHLAYVPEQGRCGNRVRVFTLGGPGQAPIPSGDPIQLTREQCLNAHMVLTTADGKTGYLVCEGDHKGPGTFVVLDLVARKVVGHIAIGVFPDGMAVIPGQAKP